MTRRDEANATFDARRYKENPARAWYQTKAWRVRRARFLRDNPTCAPCKMLGKTRPSTVANHNPPHRGDRHAFFHGPLEATCKDCHDEAIQRAEHEGFRRDVDTDGWPTDRNHPFNRTR